MHEVLTTQDSNFEITFTGNAFEIAQEIPTIPRKYGTRDFFTNRLQKPEGHLGISPKLTIHSFTAPVIAET